jgi:hypothetical protein
MVAPTGVRGVPASASASAAPPSNSSVATGLVRIGGSASCRVGEGGGRGTFQTEGRSAGGCAQAAGNAQAARAGSLGLPLPLRPSKHPLSTPKAKPAAAAGAERAIRGQQSRLTIACGSGGR